MLKKSASSASSAAARAAAGVSIIIPAATSSGPGRPRSARDSSACFRAALASTNSLTVEIIGNMIDAFPLAPALSMARS